MPGTQDDDKFLKIRMPVTIFLEASKKLFARGVSVQAVCTQIAYEIAIDHPAAAAFLDRMTLATVNEKLATLRDARSFSLTESERDAMYRLMENDQEKQ